MRTAFSSTDVELEREGLRISFHDGNFVLLLI